MAQIGTSPWGKSVLKGLGKSSLCNSTNPVFGEDEETGGRNDGGSTEAK